MAGVVYEFKHHQALLAEEQPHAAAQLLGIAHLGHGGPGQEQRPFAKSLGIHGSGHRLAGAGGVKGDWEYR